MPEQNKTVIISSEVLRKINRLRHGGQSDNDVITESISALMREKGIPDLPVIDDAYIEKHHAEWDLSSEENYCSLEDLDDLRLRKKLL